MRVSRGFSKNGISVSVTGATMMGVHIPAIGVSITFNGHIFQIQLPFGYFGHNTEGQCGEWVQSGSQLLLFPRPEEVGLLISGGTWVRGYSQRLPGLQPAVTSAPFPRHLHQQPE